MPDFLHKAFSTKSTQCMCSKCHSVTVPCFWHTCISNVCIVEASGNRHTHTQTKTQNDYHNPRACAEWLIDLDPSSCTCLQLDMPMHQLTLLQLHTLYSNEQHTFAAYTENQHFCIQVQCTYKINGGSRGSLFGSFDPPPCLMPHPQSVWNPLCHAEHY